MPDTPVQADNTEGTRPEWFAAFLADRGTRKPSVHTMKAYRQDFDAIATLIAGGDTHGISRMSLGDITTDTMRTAFAQCAKTHEAASIQRCWSTWNVLCTFLYTSELIMKQSDPADWWPPDGSVPKAPAEPRSSSSLPSSPRCSAAQRRTRDIESTS
jgi:site-specific recombinase XerC